MQQRANSILRNSTFRTVSSVKSEMEADILERYPEASAFSWTQETRAAGETEGVDEGHKFLTVTFEDGLA